MIYIELAGEALKVASSIVKFVIHICEAKKEDSK